MTTYVTCKNCGWVHFEVSYQKAWSDIHRFNAYFDTLPVRLQMNYYGGMGSSIDDYMWCGRCGKSYEQFRPAKKGEPPNGSTINPILRRKKK